MKNATTVRFENQVWNVDVENNELYLPNNKKVKVDIDEVYDILCEGDQNKIAELFAATNDNLTGEELITAIEEGELFANKNEQ